MLKRQRPWILKTCCFVDPIELSFFMVFFSGNATLCLVKWCTGTRRLGEDGELSA
jgi:hypothetical protein